MNFQTFTSTNRIESMHGIEFLTMLLVDPSLLSRDSYWLPSNYNIFSKWILTIQISDPYHIAVMNDDIAKFGYDSMQQITKKPEFMKRTSLRTSIR